MAKCINFYGFLMFFGRFFPCVLHRFQWRSVAFRVVFGLRSEDDMAHIDFRSLQRYGDTVLQFARGLAQRLAEGGGR